MTDIRPYTPPTAQDPLPDQAGNSGKYLRTDGENTSWEPLVAVEGFPNQSGNAGKFLTTNGSAASWKDPFPAQIGNGGKYLRSDGTNVYWENVAAGGGPSGNGGGSTLIFDSIASQFNGVLTTFELKINTIRYYPLSSSDVLVVLGGVIQSPGIDYVISAYNIQFTTPPQPNLECFMLSLGNLVGTSSLATTGKAIAMSIVFG